MREVECGNENHRQLSVDHRGMEPGVYFREDVRAGVPVLTADLRFFRPNAGRYLTTTEAHTVEHMLATCLRSSACADNIVYFGPMGCPDGVLPCDDRAERGRRSAAWLQETIALSLSMESVPRRLGGELRKLPRSRPARRRGGAPGVPPQVRETGLQTALTWLAPLCKTLTCFFQNFFHTRADFFI